MEKWALQVTPHAIQRYQERIDPGATRQRAEHALREAHRGAKRLHAQASDRALYAVREGLTEYRIVMRHAEGKAPAILTVLFKHETEDKAIALDEEDAPPLGSRESREDARELGKLRSKIMAAEDKLKEIGDPLVRIQELEEKLRCYEVNVENSRKQWHEERAKMRGQRGALAQILNECIPYLPDGSVLDRAEHVIETYRRMHVDAK